LPDQSEQDKFEYEPTEEEAKKAFNSTIAKLESVRNISSPILKVIQISRCMDELMVFYILVVLRSEECAYMGARFIEECSYIDSFLHEDQIGMIQ
jgi:hypothetical protein